MRQITRKQKRLVREYIDSNNIQFYNWEHVTVEHQDELEAVNDTEILWCECNRYANDYILEKERS
jgi:hypothetical protein